MNLLSYEDFIRELNTYEPFSMRRFHALGCNETDTDKDLFFRMIASYVKLYLNNLYSHQDSRLFIGERGMHAANFADKFFRMVKRIEPEFKLFSKILTETIGQTLPSDELIGYKKAMSAPEEIVCDSVLIKLRIPKNTMRSRAFGYKCRCSEAIVECIYSMEDPDITYDVAYSAYMNSFVYETGKTVKVDNFDTCPWVECSTGIHFFLDECDARHYYI